MTHRQPFHQNLKQPISNKTTESCGQKMESYVSVPIKEEFNKWLNDTFHPTYFLTVQLPDNKRFNFLIIKNLPTWIMQRNT